MSITSLSCANRPWIKFRRFLFLLHCTALFLTGWWIGWVLFLLIVSAGGRLDIFGRRMRMGQQERLQRPIREQNYQSSARVSRRALRDEERLPQRLNDVLIDPICGICRSQYRRRQERKHVQAIR
jgi:hypothetical protein